MGQDSEISWTHHTFNPWRGCTKVSDGCKNCYADTLSKRNPGVLGVWGPNGQRVIAAESYWREPLKWAAKAKAAGDRHRVFCASLADVGEGEDTMPPTSWEPVRAARRRLSDLIRATAHSLDWLLLTKRPENMPELYDRDVLELCWVGASVENRKAIDARSMALSACPAAVRFWSAEPLLEDLGSIRGYLEQNVDWVIVGGESGPGARPIHPDWARSIRNQCVAAGVSFHFKQWGEWKPISEMPESEYGPLYKSRRKAPPGEEDQQAAYDESYGRICTVPTGTVRFDGRMFEIGPEAFRSIDGHGAYQIFRVGKTAAGRMLDGRTWDEFPKPNQPQQREEA